MEYDHYDYYDNLVKAIEELSVKLNSSKRHMSKLTDEETGKWITEVIQALSEKYDVLKIDLDEVQQHM